MKQFLGVYALGELPLLPHVAQPCYTSYPTLTPIYQLEKMNITLERINELKAGTQDELKKEVLDYIIERWDDYDNKNAIFEDVLNHGCASGIVSSLIYYNDTHAFYEKHKKAISNLLYELGINDLAETFKEQWDEDDPLILDAQNQTLLAWFDFEETLRNIYCNDLEQEY